MNKTKNKGFERVSQVPRNRGRFSSPNSEPMGKPINLRLPGSLDEWVRSEAELQGKSKNDIIRAALVEQMKAARQRTVDITSKDTA